MSTTITLPFELPAEVPNGIYAALLALGAVAVLRWVWSFLQATRFFLYSGVNVRKYGEWAVVTGATDGIGLAYAQQFAKKGLNLVLISRSEDKLRNVEKDIRDSFKIQVKIVVADFSSNDLALYTNIANELKDLNIGVLVNNVGVSYPYAQFFDKLEESLIDQIISVNVTSLTKITRIVLPGMVARKKGIIVNVGSAAGLVPIGDPLYAVYSGTKAYVDFFSKSLNVEYGRKGIIIENQVPYFVTSKLSKIRVPSLTTPAPHTYAAAAISKIGYAASVVPYWTHALQHWLLLALPESLLTYVVWSHHYGIHKRALKKLQEKKD